MPDINVWLISQRVPDPPPDEGWWVHLNRYRSFTSGFPLVSKVGRGCWGGKIATGGISHTSNIYSSWNWFYISLLFVLLVAYKFRFGMIQNNYNVLWVLIIYCGVEFFHGPTVTFVIFKYCYYLFFHAATLLLGLGGFSQVNGERIWCLKWRFPCCWSHSSFHSLSCYRSMASSKASSTQSVI